MDIKITTLSENSAGHNCLAEWGLSMLVEADGIKILFDTGSGIAAIHNADRLGIDLSTVGRMVISHGHYDHTGGLLDVLRRTGRKEVIAHPDIWARKCGTMDNIPDRYTGIPFVRELLELTGASFNLSREPIRLTDNIITTGEIPMVTDYEIIEKYLYVMEGEELKHDNLPDDLAMIIDTEYGLVVILGCAHRGIINTLIHVRNITGKDNIYAAIGGTHLVHASPERMEKTATALLEMGVQYLGVSHCTGFRAAAFLSNVFGDRFFQNNAGTILKLPFEEDE